MKKFLLIALTVAMALTFATSAFAAVESLGGTEEHDVTVNVQDTSSTTVYYVTIEWEDDLAFEYSNANYVWNPEKLCYENQGGAWVDDTKDITVKNRSNAAVCATVTTEVLPGNGLTLTPSDPITVESAAKDILDYTQATAENSGVEQTGTITLTVSGTPVGLTTGANTVGTATVTITAAS